MDFDVTGPIIALYDEEVQFDEQNGENMESREDMESDREAHQIKPSIDDSSAGKLFVGGIAHETTEESFRKYFSQYGEVTNSVIKTHKSSGCPRGFGFVTYADPKIADKVLEEDHIIDGKVVEVKKTIPKKDIHVKGASNTNKIFVGGLPLSLTEDELKEYFSSYGCVTEHQILLNHTTGRPRGFGFVRFNKEAAVEKVLSNGNMHELCGKQVEIKRAEPKRAGAEHTSESRLRCCGCGSKSNDDDGGFVEVFGGGYGGNICSGYGGYADYGVYSVSPIGFYPVYGYGFWFSGAMYGAAGYGGTNYGLPAYYGDGCGYGIISCGLNDGDYGNGAYAYRNDGAANGRFYP